MLCGDKGNTGSILIISGAFDPENDLDPDRTSYPRFLCFGIQCKWVNIMNDNRYIQDILTQPAALNDLLANFLPDGLNPLSTRLAAGEFTHTVISGMGSSLSAAYPAWLLLAKSGLPVYTVSGAELLHYGAGQINSRTLLWLNSQSGRSAEVVSLLEQTNPGCVLACVNDLTSPLAARSDFTVPIWAGDEATVSTKTFSNMIAANLLTAACLARQDILSILSGLRETVLQAQAYLNDWKAHLDEIEIASSEMCKAVLIGRGSSLAAVWCGSLINKEAAKFLMEGMNSADFRHGPLELAAPDLTVVILAGDPAAQILNRRMAEEVIRYGAKVIWIGSANCRMPGAVNLVIPHVPELARPLVEIIPLQLLSIVLARRSGFQPGIFRHVSKVTAGE